MRNTVVEEKQGADGREGLGGRLRRRLRVVQKSEYARYGFECEAVALRMRLVKAKEDSDR
jgi:hypothetical protein